MSKTETSAESPIVRKSYFEQAEQTDDVQQHSVSINVFANPMCDRIAIVAEFKMQSGLKATRQSDHLQKKRSVPKSVVYDQQKPLELSESEMRKLLYVVMNEDACGKEKHQMGSKVLIKVLMDGFITKPIPAAAQQVLQVSLRLMSKEDTRSRLHALNLLLNLCIHANLICQSAVFARKVQKQRGTTRMNPVTSQASEEDQSAAERNAKINAVLDAVWMVTCETLLRMVHTAEDSAVTWGAALNLILLQITELGKANWRKLLMLDLKILKCIVLHVEPLGDDAQRLGMALLCNSVLELSPDKKFANLPDDRFAELAWPMGEIIDLFISARSAETISNCFTLIYLSTMSKLRDSAPPTARSRFNEQANTLNSLLSSMGTPYMFQKIFLHPLTAEEIKSLSNVISSVKSQNKAKGLTLRNTKAKRQNNKLLNHLDSQFVSDFFTALLKVGTDYLGLDPELEAYKERMLTHPKSLRPLLDTLEELLFSAFQQDRLHGLNWLFDLMVVLAQEVDSEALKEEPPVTPVHFGGGRGAKGRGVGKRGLSPRGGEKNLKVSPRGGGEGGGLVPPKKGGVSKEARQSVQKSPRKPLASPRSATLGTSGGAKVLVEMAKYPGSPDLGSSRGHVQMVESPRLPNLQVPTTPKAHLKLAGSTPEEKAASFEKMQTLIKTTHEKLLTSPSSAVRRGYLLVVKRLLSYIQSTTDKETGVKQSVQLINTHCANIISRNEVDPFILMQMFDLIFEFVASPAVPGADCMAKPGGLFNTDCKDTNYMQFLNGSRKISVTLLNQIDVGPLKLLFDNLSPSFENVRVVCLIFIASMCNQKTNAEKAKKTFAEVGQLAWFKNMLDDPNPQIAYHSSRFLSEYLQAQDPQQYSLALKKLIAIIPEDKIAIDFFHVLALLGDSTYLTIGKSSTTRRTARPGE
jgi:hypothetical protein